MCKQKWQSLYGSTNKVRYTQTILGILVWNLQSVFQDHTPFIVYFQILKLKKPIKKCCRFSFMELFAYYRIKYIVVYYGPWGTVMHTVLNRNTRERTYQNTVYRGKMLLCSLTQRTPWGPRYCQWWLIVIKCRALYRVTQVVAGCMHLVTEIIMSGHISQCTCAKQTG